VDVTTQEFNDDGTEIVYAPATTARAAIGGSSYDWCGGRGAGALALAACLAAWLRYVCCASVSTGQGQRLWVVCTVVLAANSHVVACTSQAAAPAPAPATCPLQVRRWCRRSSICRGVWALGPVLSGGPWTRLVRGQDCIMHRHVMPILLSQVVEGHLQPSMISMLSCSCVAVPVPRLHPLNPAAILPARARARPAMPCRSPPTCSPPSWAATMQKISQRLLATSLGTTWASLMTGRCAGARTQGGQLPGAGLRCAWASQLYCLACPALSMLLSAALSPPCSCPCMPLLPHPPSLPLQV